MNQRPYIVGITGGSGSGKTLFLRHLMEAFHPGEICLISQDNYYRPRTQQPLDENGVHNFDLPGSIDFELYASHIKSLRDGHRVQKQEYTFNNQAATPRVLAFNPAPVIVVEGIFVFYATEIARLLDLKFFIDATSHLILNRRIVRERDERGYDLADVLYRYEKHVMPTYQKYIAPHKYDADVIIPNTNHFTNALQMLTAFLKSKVGGKVKN